ncbi:hypothetical protein AOLI_G00038720 [Acnodon oligacanthus]
MHSPRPTVLCQKDFECRKTALGHEKQRELELNPLLHPKLETALPESTMGALGSITTVACRFKVTSFIWKRILHPTPLPALISTPSPTNEPHRATARNNKIRDTGPISHLYMLILLQCRRLRVKWQEIMAEWEITGPSFKADEEINAIPACNVFLKSAIEQRETAGPLRVRVMAGFEFCTVLTA